MVLTKPLVVDVMLDRVGYKADADLSGIRLIEPAAGDGAFAVTIIKRLHSSSLKFGFSFQKSLQNLAFYEIDTRISGLLRERIESQLRDYSTLLPKDLIITEDFLLSKPMNCDLIVGNPPYVRHENIPESQKIEYRKRFGTFTYRSDLYIVFYEKGLRLLNKDGILSYICSNRWLKNQYGGGLRKLIYSSYSLTEIIDLEETCPFEEDVIAYPAITTIQNGRLQKFTSYYKINKIDDLNKLDFDVEKSRTINTRNSVNWFSYQPSNSNHEKFLDSIENQGFKIGIGVATGSDKVYIRKDFESLVENELLIPIILAKDLKNNSFEWSGNYILNPFSSNGGLINLNEYPNAKKYFDSNKELLEKRHIAQKNPLAWYKTIDKISPTLTNVNKILLPDLSGNSHLFIDRGNYYPHHNLYYITGSYYNKLIILATLLMSDFVKNQLLELGNKMNGGYPRWQSQNLKRLRIPIIDSIPQKIIELLTEAYHARDYASINKIITEEHISKFEFSAGQTRLFEPKPEKYKSKA
ncbi:MAG: Eco57I restriction-modification methylase domain-containing protein [Bacteroidia bacterium]|nr:Eco57I restriction-modification methylase domain-containing protein [Bacteroidia bacterium]